MNINTSLSTISSDTNTTINQTTNSAPEIEQLQTVITQIEAQRTETTKKRSGEELSEKSAKKIMTVFPEPESLSTTTVSRAHLAGPSSSMTPPALKKKPYAPTCRFSETPPVSPFKQLFLESEKREINIHGKTVYLMSLGTASESNSRTHMNVFRVDTDNAEPILSEVLNQKLVVKIFNKTESCSYTEKTLNSLMERSLKNYVGAQELEIPVATIYNAKTAHKDCCFLQEFIPDAVDPQNSTQMRQVQTMFIKSLKEKKIFNLVPDALRMKANGVVTLVDFIYDHSDGLEITIKDALEQWTRKVAARNGYDIEKTKQFLAEFTQELAQYGYEFEWNLQIINTIFFIKSF